MISKLFTSGQRREKIHIQNEVLGIRIRIHSEPGSGSTILKRWIRGSGPTIRERWIRGSGSGSTIPECGSEDPDPDPLQNAMDPKRC